MPGKQRGIMPDVTDGDALIHRVLIKMEIPVYIPDDFDQLPAAEQQKLMAQYRFTGIRLRGDIPGQIVHVSRETLDI